MGWNNNPGSVLHRIDGLINSHFAAVAFGCRGQVNSGFGQRDTGLGQAYKLNRMGSRSSHGQGERVGQADILGGMDDKPARYKLGVFPLPTLQPARTVLASGSEPRMLNKGGNSIIVIVPAAVILEDQAPGDFLQQFRGNP